MSSLEEKQQLWIILLIVFISFIGTSIAYPIFPPLFLHPAYHSIVSPVWTEDTRRIFLGIALAAYPLGQFVGSPIIGGCSDRYGRKRVLIISLSGGVLGYFLTALSLQFNCLWLLLLSRFLTGSMEGNFAIARAMASDLQSINKFKSLGRVNSMSSIGYIMGPLLGGFLSDRNIFSWFSFAFPFYLSMVFSAVTLLLAALKLREKISDISSELTIWHRFNLIARFKFIFKSNPRLKHLLIISTIFTLAVDNFYEFGPVYLTGVLAMTPAGIAVYNAALSFTLAVGAGWLPHRLSLHYSIERIVVAGMFVTTIFLGLMSVFPSIIFLFILFTCIGLSIAIVNTNLVIQISNNADKTIQGEAMGSQMSLRMLCDSMICLMGGVLIISSLTLPIMLSCLISILAVGLYIYRVFYRST